MVEPNITWAKDQPDGGVGENMAVYTPGNGLWDQHEGYNYFSVACRYPAKPILRLRGLCSESYIDKFYYPMHVKDSQSVSYPWNDKAKAALVFVGEFATKIFFSIASKTWTIEGTWIDYGQKNDILGTTASKFQTYVLGRHTWNITNERQCSDEKLWFTELKLTGCEDGEFTCNNGHCVLMEQRCDQVAQCKDKSDERNCQLMTLEESYNKMVPPITTVSDSDFTVVPIAVNISLDLLKVIKIDQEINKIDFQFQITLEWRDNRLTYLNLKQKTSLNALTKKEVKSLWVPLVTYDNTDQKELTRLGMDWEWNTPISVIREGKFTKSGLDQVDEKYIYRGNENTLHMQQVYTWQFQCLYELHNYPFDSQVSDL